MALMRCNAADELLARKIVQMFPEVPFGILTRFALFPKLDPVTGCWEWKGFKDKLGYGRFNFDSATFRPYRKVWEWLHGESFPDGLVPDHLCRNPPCVNPSHIEAVTPRENVLRGKTIVAANAAKTHCPQGHPYSKENTYQWKGGRAGRGRQCRICTNEHSKRWQKKRRDARGLRFGSKRADTIFTEDQVTEIKTLIGKSNISLPKIAKRFGCAPGTIYKINKDETWTYVPWPKGCRPREI